MKGRARFSRSEADEIRRLLGLVRRAEPGVPQKLLRDKLRALGFYISDFAGGSAGFTASDFDDLVRQGRVNVRRDVKSGSCRTNPARPASTWRGPRATGRTASRPATRPPATSGATSRAIAALSAGRLTIRAAVNGGVPDRPGLYALYGSAATWRLLDLGLPPDSRPLYVGKAEASLASRDLKTHFATGRTGQSSPRRSFAALLSAASVLELVAMPRRPRNPESGKWTHYALEEPGDDQLTKWMWSKLRIAVWPSPPSTALRTVETAVMHRWLPPLNLTGVSTPWTSQVKAARAMMAGQAREWARRRGLDV